IFSVNLRKKKSKGRGREACSSPTFRQSLTTTAYSPKIFIKIFIATPAVKVYVKCIISINLNISYVISSCCNIYKSELSCSSMRPNTMKFSMRSRRNENWTLELLSKTHILKLQHDGKNTIENSVWDVDVEHNIKSCGGSDTIDIQATLIAPLETPRPGYDLFPGMGYYKFHDEAIIWQDALRICAQEGAHLAIINSEAESTLIKNLFAKYPNIPNSFSESSVFLGYHDLHNEGQFQTIFGETLNTTGFSRFLNGQPNNTPVGMDKDQDCGGVHREGLLNDLPCNSRFGFICERELSQ
ncbi:hypothetical protein L9F63_021380, partial [Diploptera punctata]